ncbi:hypothetical protein Q9L58_010933 [Maublancomyces gigas]|uniref:2'-5' RNA ligase n=1 Tax=Discina gigas TaxID=1032678 RepID=A0ABR3G3N6_9PEZI
MSAARYFVFVEFTDPEVRGLLNSLRKALKGKKVNDEVHVTVRGPYTQRPDPQLLSQWGEKLEGQAILIADVGMFETPKGYAVFIHAKSKVFKDIWWKPDFSGPTATQIPHVTVFETSDRDQAKAVKSFLKAEAIEIVTYGGALTVYTSRQHSLLSEEEHLFPDRSKLPQERISIKEGLLERAAKLHAHLDKPDTNPTFQQMLL